MPPNVRSGVAAANVKPVVPPVIVTEPVVKGVPESPVNVISDPDPVRVTYPLESSGSARWCCAELHGHQGRARLVLPVRRLRHVPRQVGALPGPDPG